MSATLMVKSESFISEIRKHNAKLADQLSSLGIETAKANNPAHTTPNMALVLLAVKNLISASGTYSGGNSNTDFGENRVSTKENDKMVRTVLSPTAEPIVSTHGNKARDNGVPSFFSPICNVIQVKGAVNGPSDHLLQYVSAFLTEHGGSVPVELLRKLSDSDRQIREAFATANAPK